MASIGSNATIYAREYRISFQEAKKRLEVLEVQDPIMYAKVIAQLDVVRQHNLLRIEQGKGEQLAAPEGVRTGGSDLKVPPGEKILQAVEGCSQPRRVTYIKQNSLPVWIPTVHVPFYKPDSKEVYTPGMTFTEKSYDRARANTLLKLCESDRKLAAKVYHAVLEASRSVYHNGSIAALVAVWKKVNSLPALTPPVKLSKMHELAMATYLMIPRKPVDRVFDYHEQLYSPEAVYKFNMAAGSGTSFGAVLPMTDGLLLSAKARVMEIVRELNLEMRNSTYKESASFFNSMYADPTLSAFLLKTKDEVRLAEKKLEKCRPYHSGSIEFRLLIGPILAYWKHYLVARLVEDRRSSLLFGFSWMGKTPGGKLLADRILELDPGESLYAGFGDDQYIVARLLDETFGVLAYDISAMDQSCGVLTNTASVTRIKWDMQSVLAPNNEAVDLVLNFWRDIVSASRVIGPKGAVWRRQGGVLTGSNGVTEIETLTIAGIQGVAASRFHGYAFPSPTDAKARDFSLHSDFRRLFDDVKDKSDMNARADLYTNVLLEYGFNVKPETKALQFFSQSDFETDGFSTDLPLLGQRLQRHPAVGYAPLPDYNRLMVGLLFNMESIRSVMRGNQNITNLALQLLDLIRVRAYVQQGLCLDEDLYGVFREYYNHKSSLLVGLLADRQLTVGQFWDLVKDEIPGVALPGMGFDDAIPDYASQVIVDHQAGGKEIATFPTLNEMRALYVGEERVRAPAVTPIFVQPWGDQDEDEEIDFNAPIAFGERKVIVADHPPVFSNETINIRNPPMNVLNHPIGKVPPDPAARMRRSLREARARQVEHDSARPPPADPDQKERWKEFQADRQAKWDAFYKDLEDTYVDEDDDEVLNAEARAEAIQLEAEARREAEVEYQKMWGDYTGRVRSLSDFVAQVESEWK